jgi:hypothetical protein
MLAIIAGRHATNDAITTTAVDILNRPGMRWITAISCDSSCGESRQVFPLDGQARWLDGFGRRPAIPEDAAGDPCHLPEGRPTPMASRRPVPL